jgi:hypothetical protein
MLLADWEVNLRRKSPPCPGAAAQVKCRASTREVYVYLSDELESYTRAEQRRCIVHELVHLHLNPMLAHLEHQFGGWDEWPVIGNGHKSHEEYAVDDLARIIAPHMPLPPKAAKP